MQPAKIKKQDFFNLVTRILPNYAIKRTFPAYRQYGGGGRVGHVGHVGLVGLVGQNAPGAARDAN